MSSLTLHLLIDEQATADKWSEIITRYLRALADQIEAAPGPVEVAADWPDLEAWEQYPAGGQAQPVTVSANTAIALRAMLRRQTEPPPELLERLDHALRRAGWPLPPDVMP
jgi:hypothetical protein